MGEKQESQEKPYRRDLTDPDVLEVALGYLNAAITETIYIIETEMGHVTDSTSKVREILIDLREYLFLEPEEDEEV